MTLQYAVQLQRALRHLYGPTDTIGMCPFISIWANGNKDDLFTTTGTQATISGMKIFELCSVGV